MSYRPFCPLYLWEYARPSVTSSRYTKIAEVLDHRVTRRGMRRESSAGACTAHPWVVTPAVRASIDGSAAARSGEKPSSLFLRGGKSGSAHSALKEIQFLPLTG